MQPWFSSALRDEEQFDLQPGQLTPAHADQRSVAAQGQRTPHCQMDRLSADPHDFAADEAVGAARDDAPLVLLYVAAGGIVGTAGGQPFTARAGEGLLWDSRVGIDGHAGSRTRLLRLLVDRDRALDGVPGATVPEAAVIPPTPTLQACAGFLVPMTATSLQNPGRDSVDRLERVLIALLGSQIAEVRSHVWSVPDEDGPSIRTIQAYIDRHMREPTLTPTSMAAALGVTASHLRSVFQDSGSTVASAIRTRRVQAVAHRLRQDPAPWLTTQLAASYGFGSASALTRSFSSVFGCTPGAYAKALGPKNDSPATSRSATFDPLGRIEVEGTRARRCPPSS